MPTLELILLGTGSPIHQPHRSGNAQIIRGGDASVLIDVGWGATVRMYQCGVGPPQIDAVFVTHLHSDHTTDFADLLVMRWVGGITKPLRVYGPDGDVVYENRGVIFGKIAWGKIKSYEVFEDTQKVAAFDDYLVEQSDSRSQA